jgi:type II secretory pathway pseudopilin PulG
MRRVPRARSKSRRARSERGSTLIELLAATAIMGIAVVTILAGASATFTTSDSNRQSTTAGIVTRDYAEALDVAVSQAGAWCAGTYSVSAYYTPPTGYSATATYGACPAASAAQYQTVVITATAPNGATEVLRTVVRQP